MKKYFKYYMKAKLKACLTLAALMIFISLLAKDAKQPATTIKAAVPVFYYQTFMLGVAVLYAIYLYVRAKRRKRNSKITE